MAAVPNPVGNKPPGDLESLWFRLVPKLEAVLNKAGLSGQPFALQAPKAVLDDSAKLLIRDAIGRPWAVLICSPPVAPGIVARGVDVAADAKQLLGDEEGRVILKPLTTGTVDGRTYVLLPWRQPLSEFRWIWAAQRFLLRPHLLRWLREVTRMTLRPPGIQTNGDFATALRHIAAHQRLGPAIRNGAAQATERLDCGQWTPMHALAHNDLWKGNILLDPKSPWRGAAFGRFAIIDWLGASVAGYPIYDLIRLAQSFKVSQRTLDREVRLHCSILGCELVDAGGYLAAALGNLGLHLEEFPEDRYVELADACWSTLSLVGER